MNIEALESMEHFAEQVLSLSAKHQDELFETLRRTCLTEEDVSHLEKSVSLYKMFIDPSFFKEMQNNVLELYLEREIRT